MQQGEARLKIEKVVENGTKEMETIYLPIKNQMIEELNIMNNLTQLIIDYNYYDNEDDKEDQIKEDIDELEVKLRPKIEDITINLKDIEYNSRSRLLVKTEKFQLELDESSEIISNMNTTIQNLTKQNENYIETINELTLKLEDLNGTTDKNVSKSETTSATSLVRTTLAFVNVNDDVFYCQVGN